MVRGDMITTFHVAKRFAMLMGLAAPPICGAKNFTLTTRVRRRLCAAGARAA